MIDTQKIFFESLIQMEMENIENKVHDECSFSRQFKGYNGSYCNLIPVKYCDNKLCKYQDEVKENILDFDKRYMVITCKYYLYKKEIDK